MAGKNRLPHNYRLRCTSGCAPSSKTEFTHYHTWEAHEISKHGRKWVCDCEADFATFTEYREHIEETAHSGLDEVELGLFLPWDPRRKERKVVMEGFGAAREVVLKKKEEMGPPKKPDVASEPHIRREFMTGFPRQPRTIPMRPTRPPASAAVAVRTLSLQDNAKRAPEPVPAFGTVNPIVAVVRPMPPTSWTYSSPQSKPVMGFGLPASLGRPMNPATKSRIVDLSTVAAEAAALRARLLAETASKIQPNALDLNTATDRTNMMRAPMAPGRIFHLRAPETERELPETPLLDRYLQSKVTPAKRPVSTGSEEGGKSKWFALSEE